MLALLLQTTQLARQVAPNVYVTVQPPPGGMPEWAKILISAGTGAVFALLGSLGMELLKRRLDRKETTNAVSKQLADELTHNLRLVDSARRIFADAAKAQEDSRIAAVFVLQLMTTAATTDRYEDNFEKKKGTVHELDPKQSLAQFYRLFPRTLKGQEDFAAASSFLEWRRSSAITTWRATRFRLTRSWISMTRLTGPCSGRGKVSGLKWAARGCMVRGDFVRPPTASPRTNAH